MTRSRNRPTLIQNDTKLELRLILIRHDGNSSSHQFEPTPTQTDINLNRHQLGLTHGATNQFVYLAIALWPISPIILEHAMFPHIRTCIQICTHQLIPECCQLTEIVFGVEVVDSVETTCTII